MSAIRIFNGETFDGECTIEIAELRDHQARVSVTEVGRPADNLALEGHLWVYDDDYDIAEGVYETLLSMHTIEEDYIEALGFQYV